MECNINVYSTERYSVDYIVKRSLCDNGAN